MALLLQSETAAAHPEASCYEQVGEDEHGALQPVAAAILQAYEQQQTKLS